MQRTLKQYIVISLKGIAMGAADVVPGVSGGTIAFISGIYEELINSLKSINLSLFKELKTGGIPALWKAVNANFLIALLLGIGISILSLAKGITYLLANYPIQIWSFFFGLILASTLIVAQKIGRWNFGVFLSFIVGAIIAFYITIAVPGETPEALWFIFLSGAIAICAMILPGISGSFILLLLGKYTYILESLTAMNVKVIITFAAGCFTGLISFSHILSWMFKKYHDLTVAVLSGFMIGSLNKVWPWKHTETWRENSHGEMVPVVQNSVLPQHFEGETFIVQALLLCVAGFLLVYFLEKFSAKKQS
jgi:putative membrane protein